MNIGVVGYGFVGKSLCTLFERGEHRCIVFDKYLPEFSSEDCRARVNDCELVFVAVPTPLGEDGHCDLSEVVDVLSWVNSPVCLKSTVPPGTVDSLVRTFGIPIAFSPEYVGETPFHPTKQSPIPELVAVGGSDQACRLVLRLYQSVCGPQPKYFKTDAVTAELSKYMENCFFATKVAFVAQFYLLAEKFGADFTQMREIWLADSRIGRSHSAVIGSLGYGGRCLPKDMQALIQAAEERGGADLLKAIQLFNTSLRLNGRI